MVHIGQHLEIDVYQRALVSDHYIDDLSICDLISSESRQLLIDRRHTPRLLYGSYTINMAHLIGEIVLSPPFSHEKVEIMKFTTSRSPLLTTCNK